MSTASVAAVSTSSTVPVVPAQIRSRGLLFWFAVAWLVLIVLAAASAQWLPIASYRELVGQPAAAPGGTLDTALGTDALGRSVLSRLIFGAQVSLLVGTVATLVAFAVGTVLGLLAGYLRGWVDGVISYVADAMLAFPPLVLLLALAAVLQPSIKTLLVSLTIIVIPTFVRLARANAMAWSSREFVRAAQNMGAPPLRVMFREILPNLLPTLAAYLPIIVATLIVAEGSASFLGFGVPSPMPSWGGMISDGKDDLTYAPLLVFLPAGAIFLSVFSLNVVGDRMRAKYGGDSRS